MVNGLKPLTIFEKSFIVDVRLSSKYASGNVFNQFLVNVSIIYSPKTPENLCLEHWRQKVKDLPLIMFLEFFCVLTL